MRGVRSDTSRVIMGGCVRDAIVGDMRPGDIGGLMGGVTSLRDSE